MTPLILYTSQGYKKNKILFLLSALAILITVKRGAIIAFAAGNLFYYLGFVKSNFNFKQIFYGISIFLVLALAGSYFFNTYEIQIADRFTADQFDLENDRAGSGRVGLYTGLYNDWLESDNKFFGFGNQEDTYRNIRRLHAHSDILGFLYNHGLVGIILILILYIKIYNFYLIYRKYDQNNSALLLTFFVILILVNFYSGLFRTTSVIYFFAVLPYLQLRIISIKRKNIYLKN